MAGHRIKILRRERFAHFDRWHVKIAAECGTKSSKSQVTDVKQRTATLTRRDRDKHSACSGMAGNVGLKKPMLDPFVRLLIPIKTSFWFNIRM